MKVNGKPLRLSELESTKIQSLLEYLKLRPEMVAIQRNGNILKREVWNQIELEEEDRVEILRFVGGG
ncbi:sulfur carrier protein ThiS [Leptospira kmetyi]|uniref:Sulfur carrier protein ThiS n=1 Tax=Leptospira kmetyi TaxID=408139 RepID=A0A2M9XU85_9LEPT|nr:sulfur carrier protein ThiS [Leptospira kmetyi]AYV54168.1 sulfur carrier protein ThiS [Leptospira kmetyi]EQA53274.1 thiamine biosynthesis protein ThiS [Leptospira kmetyi serovar Malaysia str. Bejo-Iso9]PJZ29711.1 thiamine biosynthesis protein ThiS [Leptospira kmetyi]PJZ42921.1 thiamine biosynthesis protein ThiS [Leptospira kmetyi]TGK22513.1 sulfur carrier protein ThiS [Leptospira kmetyi]